MITPKVIHKLAKYPFLSSTKAKVAFKMGNYLYTNIPNLQVLSF